VKRIEEGEAERQRLADAEKEERRRCKAKAKEDAGLRKAQAIQEAAERKASSPVGQFLLDGQSESVVTKIYNRVQELLTSGESIQYISVQAKPVKIAPDAIVLTSRRLMLFRPKVLGSMSFQDFLWRDLRDTHLSEGLMFGTISAKEMNGGQFELGYLPKNQARRIYRICQEKEEEAIEERRRREMEENRAGAANVVVHGPTEQMQPNAASTADVSDPLEKLTKLKKMLDAGLIEQREYDENKKRILESI
jgi:hypothetical protein